jgi:hypothetical protein
MKEQNGIDLSTLKLEKGRHISREDGLSFLEAVAWFAGEPHSDSPKCVCPVLANFARAWSNTLCDDRRQQLVSYIPRLPGTSCDGFQRRRECLAADWLLRTCCPEFLEAADLPEEAAALRSVPEIRMSISRRALSKSVEDVIRTVHHEARCGESAAEPSAYIDGNAVVAAPWAALLTRSWDDPWATHWRAIREATMSAIFAAGWVTACAALDNGCAYWPKAMAAAQDALAPRVARLQASTFDLLDRMIRPCRKRVLSRTLREIQPGTVPARGTTRGVQGVTRTPRSLETE